MFGIHFGALNVTLSGEHGRRVPVPADEIWYPLDPFPSKSLPPVIREIIPPVIIDGNTRKCKQRWSRCCANKRSSRTIETTTRCRRKYTKNSYHHNRRIVPSNPKQMSSKSFMTKFLVEMSMMSFSILF
jgi:hypothetical protein